MTLRFKYRLPYDQEADEKAGAQAALTCEDSSLTQQQFVEDCDINVLARRFGLVDAPMPVGAFHPSHYGDFSDVPDLRTAMDLVNDAKNKFMMLPAKLRERFNNQPGRLWEFVNDPENVDEAVRLGLLVREPIVAPTGSQEPKTPPEVGGGFLIQSILIYCI